MFYYIISLAILVDQNEKEITVPTTVMIFQTVIPPASDVVQ